MINQYVKTIIITIVLVTVGVCFSVFDVYQKTKNQFENTTEKITTRFIHESIEELLEEAKLKPDDYAINLKLGILYEQGKNFKAAEEQYKKALTKAPRSQLTLYRYALLCIEQNRFDEAILLIENIPDRADKSVIIKKLLVYESMGDKLQLRHDYLNATKMYTLAYKYAKVLNKQKTDEITKKISSSYISLADEEVSSNNYEQASLALVALLKLIDDPEAKYKLALIYKPFDLKKCATTMEELLETKPQLVNLELYYSILEELTQKAIAVQNRDEINYYKHKQSRLKKFIVKNFVFSDEFEIDDAKFTKPSIIGKRHFEFYITNQNPARISRLLLKINFKFPNSKTEEKKILVNFKKEGFAVQREHVEIPLDIKNFTTNLLDSNYVRIEISAKKNKNYDWALLKNLNMLYK